MGIRVLFVALLVVGIAGALAYVLPGRVDRIAAQGVSAPAASVPSPTSLPSGTVNPVTVTPTVTSLPARVIASPIAVARATLPPVFTPTSIPPTATTVVTRAPTSTPVPSTGSAGSAGSAPASIPTAPPLPTSTFTPTSTRTATPSPTPTPLYDFVVTEVKEIPQPQYRSIAYIRGRLVDADGNLVKGAYFEIRSDAIPIAWTAVYPYASIPADGTAVFPVSRGTFSVRILGGRSEYAGWMSTGKGLYGPMSDWEFTFVTTTAKAPLVTPTNTPPGTPVPTFTGTATPVSRSVLSPL